MKNLPAIYDGDTGPVLRFQLKDGGTAVDLASIAVELKIVDAATGTTLCTRPGVPVSPKSGGYVDVWLKGLESDWDGAGRDLLVVPKFYMALDANGAAATNLLTNPSFDTGAGTVADNWTQSGTLGSTIYSLKNDDPAPPIIFGKTQQVSTPSAGSTSIISQSPAISLVAGDYVSGWAWQRAYLGTGASLAGSNYYLKVALNGSDAATTSIASGDSDWRLVRVETVATTSRTAATLTYASYDALVYDTRVDDAMLYKGRTKVFHADPMRLPVKPRVRPLKTNFTTENFIKGRGGFEFDGNADGVADGWAKTGSLTYALEVDPDDLDTASLGAQKVTVAASSTDQLRLIWRGHAKNGETWKFQVRYKNSGALTGSPANGAFGLVLHTEEYDGAYETSSLASGNFPTSSTAAYTTVETTLPLTADRSCLVLDINLKTATGGSVWLDNAVLRRSV